LKWKEGAEAKALPEISFYEFSMLFPWKDVRKIRWKLWSDGKVMF
jgi:hypothetical protein